MANLSAAKLRSQRRHSPQPITSETIEPVTSNQHDLETQVEQLVLAAQPSMPLSKPVHLLIASIGNPAPYLGTRHSAGHTLLRSLVSLVDAPLLTKSRDYGGAASTIYEPSYTFFQSPSLMNVSGPPVLKAWKQFISQHNAAESVLGLVILHDELELAVGQLKIKRGEGSARGHNGIKSVQQNLQMAGLITNMEKKFIKVGVGIGRPVSRARDDVSDYVLGQLTGAESKKIREAAVTLAETLRKEVMKLGEGKGGK